MHWKVNYKTSLYHQRHRYELRRLDNSFMTVETVPDEIKPGQFLLWEDLSSMNVLLEECITNIILDALPSI